MFIFAERSGGVHHFMELSIICSRKKWTFWIKSCFLFVVWQLCHLIVFPTSLFQFLCSIARAQAPWSLNIQTITHRNCAFLKRGSQICPLKNKEHLDTFINIQHNMLSGAVFTFWAGPVCHGCACFPLPKDKISLLIRRSHVRKFSGHLSCPFNESRTFQSSKASKAPRSVCCISDVMYTYRGGEAFEH